MIVVARFLVALVQLGLVDLREAAKIFDEIESKYPDLARGYPEKYMSPLVELEVELGKYDTEES